MPARPAFFGELYVSLLLELDGLIEVRHQMAELQDNRYEPEHRKIWTN